MSTEPVGPDRPKVGKRKTSAVGIPGIAHTMQYALSEMGAIRSAQTLLRMNHIDGFDCPELRLARPRSPQDCRVLRERCQGRGLGSHPQTHRAGLLRRQLDRRTAAAARPLARAQRPLTEPMYLAPDATHYEPIGWDDAFALVAARLARWPTRTVAVSTRSGRASNEAAFVTSSSPAGSAPTTCPTARTCATSRAAPRSTRRSASARARSRSTTSRRRPT